MTRCIRCQCCVLHQKPQYSLLKVPLTQVRLLWDPACNGMNKSQRLQTVSNRKHALVRFMQGKMTSYNQLTARRTR